MKKRELIHLVCCCIEDLQSIPLGSETILNTTMAVDFTVNKKNELITHCLLSGHQWRFTVIIKQHSSQVPALFEFAKPAIHNPVEVICFDSKKL